MSGLARGIVVVERQTTSSCRSSSIIRLIVSSSAGGGGTSHRRSRSNSFLVPEAYRRRNNDERNVNVGGSRSRRRSEQRHPKEPRWSNNSGVSGPSSSSSGGRAGGSLSPRRAGGSTGISGRGSSHHVFTSVNQINLRISSEKGGRGMTRGTPSSRRLRRVIEDQHYRSSRTTPSSSPDTSMTATSSTKSDGQSTLSRGYADILRDVEGGGRAKRKPLDMDGLRRLEDKVGIAMAEYVGLLNGGQSSFVAGGENNNESTSSRERELLVVDLHDAEASYRRIVSDFASLITGWSDFAESASSNSSSWKDVNNAEEDESDGGSTDESQTSAIRERWKHNDRHTKYEDAMSRAVRHLESYEGLYRQRLDVLAAKRRDNDDDGMSSKDLGVIGKITSLLGGIFSTNSIDDSFNKSWDRPDNKKSSSTKGKDSTSPDFYNTVLSQRDSDLRLITLLYEHILLANHSAYSLGEKMKEESVQRSNRLLNRWISSYCTSSSRFADKRDDPTLDDYVSSGIRRIFHVVIRLNTDLHTIDGMKDAEEWLQRMSDLGKSSAMIHRLAQDVDAHNLVLLGYCNLCKSFHHHDPSSSKLSHKDTFAKKVEMEKRRFVVNGAEKMLHVLAEQMEPKVMSLNLALNAIAKAGAGFPDDSICSMTNKLIFKLLGEEEYRNLNEPHAAPPDSDEYDLHNVTRPISTANLPKHLRPNLDTYHWLVDIYSTSNNIVYTKRASAILNKMIRIRADQDSAYLTGDGRSSFAPSTGTHNKVLHALTTEVEAAIFFDAKARETTAREATKLLDSMVLHKTSMPSPITYLFLIRLWQNTQSSEAGEYAEEILSRMEILGLYQNDKRILSNAYFQVINCWYTAARADRSGAADRAFR